MARPDTSFHPHLRCLQDGALGGLAGGVLFGVLMAFSRGLSSLAGVAGSTNPLVGIALLLALGAITGVLFALLARGRFRSNAAYAILGLLWGVGVWAVVVLLIIPSAAGDAVSHPWTVTSFRTAIPTLLGHVILGATTARTYDYLQCRDCAG